MVWNRVDQILRDGKSRRIIKAWEYSSTVWSTTSRGFQWSLEGIAREIVTRVVAYRSSTIKFPQSDPNSQATPRPWNTFFPFLFFAFHGPGHENPEEPPSRNGTMTKHTKGCAENRFAKVHASTRPIQLFRYSSSLRVLHGGNYYIYKPPCIMKCPTWARRVCKTNCIPHCIRFTNASQLYPSLQPRPKRRRRGRI